MSREVSIGPVQVGGTKGLVLIAGPCVIESEKSCLESAAFLSQLTREIGMPFIFKASYDKANRSSIKSFRGPGRLTGLKILKRIKKDFQVPVLSDVHGAEEVADAAEVLDCLQIPAFLCRQTDLLLAAAKTQLPVNIKKGQFLAPWDMESVIQKVISVGNHNILLTERGASFGYNNLVTDFRSLVILRSFGYPVVFDGTHSVQLPGGLGERSDGQSEYVPYLSRAAAAVGMDALFLEVHPDPPRALSDGPNMVRHSELKELLNQIKAIDDLLRKPSQSQNRDRGHLKIYIDGGSRGNPGEAAIGVLIQGENGLTEEISRRIGRATNNVAEYSALLAALERGLGLGASTLHIYTDSELLARQMIGRYQVKDANLKKLWQKARDLQARFKEVRIDHVPREKNKMADALVNKALDES